MLFLLYLILKDLYIYYLLQFNTLQAPKDVKHWWFANKYSQNIIQSNYNTVNRYYKVKKRQSPLFYVEVPLNILTADEINQGIINIFNVNKKFFRTTSNEIFVNIYTFDNFGTHLNPRKYLFQLSKNFTHGYSSIIDYHFGSIGRHYVPNRYLRFTEVTNPTYINTNIATSNMHFRYYKPVIAWQVESLPIFLNPKRNDNYRHRNFILRYTTCDLLFPYIGLFFSQPLNSIDVKNRQIMESYMIRWRLRQYKGSFITPGSSTYPSIYIEDLLGRLNWGLTRKEFLKTNFNYIYIVFKNLLYEFLFILPFDYSGFLILVHYFELLFFYLIASWLIIFPFFIPFIWLIDFLIMWSIIIIWPLLKIFIKYLHSSTKDDENQVFKLYKEFWEFKFIFRSRIIFFKNKFYELFFNKKQ
jgi:hypothetical protein